MVRNGLQVLILLILLDDMSDIIDLPYRPRGLTIFICLELANVCFTISFVLSAGLNSIRYTRTLLGHGWTRLPRPDMSQPIYLLPFTVE